MLENLLFYTFLDTSCIDFLKNYKRYNEFSDGYYANEFFYVIKQLLQQTRIGIRVKYTVKPKSIKLYYIHLSPNEYYFVKDTDSVVPIQVSETSQALRRALLE
jgi:hypothetical protein